MNSMFIDTPSNRSATALEQVHVAAGHDLFHVAAFDGHVHIGTPPTGRDRAGGLEGVGACGGTDGFDDQVYRSSRPR